MIGRMIDRAALTVLGTAALYLFFLNAGMGIPVSVGLTFVCAALARYAIRHRPRRWKATAAQAEAALESIAMMPEGEARAALLTLAGIDEATVLIRHPQGTFTLDELFRIWREKGNAAAVVVSCGAEEAAVQFAKARGMSLIDRGALLKRLRRTGLFARAEPGRAASSRLARMWRALRVRPRMFAYAASLMCMYMATGRALCLICALGVMGLAGAKWIEKAA